MLKNPYFLQKELSCQEGPGTDGVRGLPTPGHHSCPACSVAAHGPGLTGTRSVSTGSSTDPVVTAPSKEGYRIDRVK